MGEAVFTSMKLVMLFVPVITTLQGSSVKVSQLETYFLPINAISIKCYGLNISF